MGAFALTNGKVTVDGVDLSDHGVSFTLDTNADAVETTAFSASGQRTYTGGLKGGAGSITFRQDYAASSVDATLNDLQGATVAFALKGVNEDNGATSPEYQFNAVVTKYDPTGGTLGDVAGCTLEFTVTGAITRDVTA